MDPELVAMRQRVSDRVDFVLSHMSSVLNEIIEKTFKVQVEQASLVAEIRSSGGGHVEQVVLVVEHIVHVE